MNLHFPAEELEYAVDRFGTPLYIYDQNLLEERCDRLNSLFNDLPVSWLYAIKANDNPHLLEIINRKGLGLDTVSYEEVLLSLQFVDDPSRIFYTENNMTDTEMDQAIQSGVRLNIGSFSRLESYCRHPGADTCCIRINPAIGDGHHDKVDTGKADSKFGIRRDLIDESFRMAGQAGVRIEGLHMHIGSGIKNPANMYEAIRLLLEIADRYDSLQYVNFGGGLPIPYEAGEQEFDLAEFERITRPLLEQFLEKKKGRFRFYFEPGRWIVGPCGMLVTRVNTIKDQGSRTFLGTDTGFHHLLRPILYEAHHEIINISRPESSAAATYDVAGNICESGDILGEQRVLPESEIGDILAIKDAGAYGMTMASHYNRRAFPAEVLKTPGNDFRQIRARLTPQEQVERHLADCNYSMSC